LPPPPADRLVAGVRRLLGTEVTGSRPMTGGCISEARRIELADGTVVFAKSGHGLPDGLLDAEVAGLRWLAEAGPAAVRVPAVLAHDAEVLVLEWIEPGVRGAHTAAALGTGLATLHAAGAPGFGAERDGFIGTLHQRNTPLGDDWPDFWFTRRIEPLVRQAHDRGHLGLAAVPLVERLGTRLAAIAGPPEPPARLHGDLWAGNVLIGAGGVPWIVDPAAYGGHREVDLAMLDLFGPLEPATIGAYQEATPLADGWRARLGLWQLEPLLTHTVMFGGGYGARALDVLRRFT
jgi:fructosamine-3-kinase